MTPLRLRFSLSFGSRATRVQGTPRGVGWATGGMMSQSADERRGDGRPGLATERAGGDPAAVVRCFYRWFELRDLSQLSSLFAEEVAWLHGPGVVPSSLEVSPPRQIGRDTVLSFLAELVDQSGGTCRWRLRRLLSHEGGDVVAEQEITACGQSLDTGYLLFTVRGDLIQQVEVLSPVPSDAPGR